MPGTFLWTAQVQPVCELGMSDVRQAEPDTWLDVSCYVHEAELFRGRERFNERFQPGTATVTFDNRTGWGDLVGSPAAVELQPLRPGRHIRVGVTGPFDDGPVVTRWLWRGFIDQATPAYDPVLHDIVTVNCVDALGEAGMIGLLPGPLQGVNERVDTRINRVLTSVGWWAAKRKIGAGTALMQGTTLGAGASDLMTIAADSAGGVVFGDVDGDVVYRDIDWMLYDPDTPPDGEIGNVDPGTPPLPDGPVYIDPTPGYVYEPDVPPAVHPGQIRVCATDGTDGTLIERGAAYRLFVQAGRLYYESSGHTWDMGLYAGGCTGTMQSPGVGAPTRIDDPAGDDVWEIAPFPGIEVPPEDLGLVELVAFTQSGMSDPFPAASTTPGPITPGVGCLLVVLLNAVGSATVDPGLAATCTGGGLTWTSVAHADAWDGGASSWIWVAAVGRDDPGVFSLSVDWTGTVVEHVCTVWKVIQVRDDYMDRLAAGTVPYAVTHSDGLLEVIQPGDGPQTVPYVDGVGTPALHVEAYDVTIAQSIAEEGTPPYGATFDDSDGVWTAVTASPAVTVALWSDTFDRADGAIGPDWLTNNNDGIDYATVAVPFQINSGAAVHPMPSSVVPAVSSSMHWHEPQDPDQSMEIEVENAIGNNAYIVLFTNINDTDQACLGAVINFYDDAVGPGSPGVMHILLADFSATGTAVIGATVDVPYAGEPVKLRLESDATGDQRCYVNGDVVVAYLNPAPKVGPYVGMATAQSWYLGTPYTPPRILRAGSVLADALKTSWVAGWRFGSTSDNVTWSDVNVGPTDLQSSQSALAVSVRADPGTFVSMSSSVPVAIGGVTDPYRYTETTPPTVPTPTPKITKAEAYDSTDVADPGLPIWFWSPAGGS